MSEGFQGSQKQDEDPIFSKVSSKSSHAGGASCGTGTGLTMKEKQCPVQSLTSVPFRNLDKCGKFQRLDLSPESGNKNKVLRPVAFEIHRSQE